jgi:membrane protein implicated in regulation of membrane protease activity
LVLAAHRLLRAEAAGLLTLLLADFALPPLLSRGLAVAAAAVLGSSRLFLVAFVCHLAILPHITPVARMLKQEAARRRSAARTSFATNRSAHTKKGRRSASDGPFVQRWPG